jgi:hypothetical protein
MPTPTSLVKATRLVLTQKANSMPKLQTVKTTCALS